MRIVPVKQLNFSLCRSRLLQRKKSYINQREYMEEIIKGLLFGCDEYEVDSYLCHQRRKVGKYFTHHNSIIFIRQCCGFQLNKVKLHMNPLRVLQ